MSTKTPPPDSCKTPLYHASNRSVPIGSSRGTGRSAFGLILMAAATILTTTGNTPVQVAFAEEGNAHVTINYAVSIQPILAEHCLVCHGQDEAEAGLRLDRPDGAMVESDSGHRAIVPGHPKASQLMSRITATDETRMPPEGEPLSAAQVNLLRQWIAEGAEWQTHWAYRPLNDDKTLPQGSSGDVPISRNSIDDYVADQLAVLQTSASVTASRRTLIRRLSLDLLGLPPTPSEVHAFVEDTSPDAYARLVDRLLASPRFGERWGRHWLDKARYADSDGYEKDRSRPDAFRYRDWVIASINDDLPFDQFTIEQLAGDLLPSATDEQRLATAFHRQTLTNTEGGTDQEQWRVAAVMDRTETMGTVWLGLTVGCARCHTHKYDAITHAEYYQLFAYFNNADEVHADVLRSESALREYERLQPAYVEKLNQLQHEKGKLQRELGFQDQADWEQQLADSSPRPGHQDALELQRWAKIARQQRSEVQQSRLDKAYQRSAKSLVAIEAKLTEHLKQKPMATMQVRVVAERNEGRRSTHVMRRGDFEQLLAVVQPGTLGSLPSIDALLESESKNQPDRLRLAKWLVHRQNPIVPRVVANQVWQNLFGEGLVVTPNDFGVRGEAPSLPRLLDHLASEYLRRGWSRKQLIRYIVNSHTYRQSSEFREDLAQRDPRNRWLARQNRFRVEAEVVRDISLAVSGLLSDRIGGPSVFPPMPAEVAAISYANNFKWAVSEGGDRYRRGLYTFFKRTSPHPTLTTFDCPDANTTNVKRNRSNTPLAALTLMNNEVYTEAASALAESLLSESYADDTQRIRQAFERCLARPASLAEVAALRSVLGDARQYYLKHKAEAEKIAVGPAGRPVGVAERAAWAVALRVLLNVDEFITRE